MKRAAFWAWAIAGLVGAALPVAAGQYRILLRAEPARIPADGLTSATVVAEVRMASGESAPDGLEVRFFASAGNLTPAATTVDGVARAILVSATAAQTATITAVAGDARQECRVEFVDDRPGGESRTLSVNGQYVAYSADDRLIVALGDARLCYRQIETRARSLQYDTTSETIRAQGSVVFTDGTSEPVPGDRLSYELRRGLGYLRRQNAAGEFEWLRLADGAEPAAVPETELAEGELEPLDHDARGTWVVAGEINLLPGDRIHFRRASIYVEGVRTLALPNYVVSLTGAAADNIFGQLISLSSNGGLNLDLPIYLAAGERRLRTLHVRRLSGDGYGLSLGQSGWSLGIDDEYSSGRAEGRWSLDDITRSTRSMRWYHSQQMSDDTQGDLALNYYRYSADYPAAASAHVSLRRRLSGYDVALRAQGTSFGGQAYCSTDLTLNWRSLVLGGSGARCDLATIVGYGRAPYETVYRPGEPVRYERQSTLHQGLRIGLRLPVQPVDQRTSLNASWNTQLYHYMTGANRLSSDLRLALQRRLSDLGAANLAYTYSLRRGASYGGYGQQRIDASLYARRGDRWQGTAFFSYDLGPGGHYGSLDFVRRLPWQGGQRWHLDAAATISRFGNFSYTDTTLALARQTGNYDLRLCFSPSSGSSQFDQYQYTYEYGYGLRPIGSRRFWVELAPRRF
jgi:hypothetical protein